MRKLSLLVLVVVGLGAPARAADFFFKNGDTVVMIGDSITEQHLYSNYVEMWTVTRFPNWKLTFRNTGIGGDTSGGGNGRFKRDVARYHPTAMTVDFGMNDAGYGGFNKQRYRNYMNGLQGMANQAKALNIRTAWVTPQPLDTDTQGRTALTGYNQTLEQFSAGVKEIAEKNHGLFVDQFHPYLSVLDKARGCIGGVHSDHGRRRRPPRTAGAGAHGRLDPERTPLPARSSRQSRSTRAPRPKRRPRKTAP